MRQPINQKVIWAFRSRVVSIRLVVKWYSDATKRTGTKELEAYVHRKPSKHRRYELRELHSREISHHTWLRFYNGKRHNARTTCVTSVYAPVSFSLRFRSIHFQERADPPPEKYHLYGIITRGSGSRPVPVPGSGSCFAVSLVIWIRT